MQAGRAEPWAGLCAEESLVLVFPYVLVAGSIWKVRMERSQGCVDEPQATGRDFSGTLSTVFAAVTLQI